MNEMVERVARQIFSANTGTPYYGVYHPAFEHEQEHWEVLARAAIEAMREPTPAMMQAGADASPMWDTGSEDVYAIAVNDSADVFAAMIDAALKEP